MPHRVNAVADSRSASRWASLAMMSSAFMIGLACLPVEDAVPSGCGMGPTLDLSPASYWPKYRGIPRPNAPLNRARCSTAPALASASPRGTSTDSTCRVSTSVSRIVGRPVGAPADAGKWTPTPAAGMRPKGAHAGDHFGYFLPTLWGSNGPLQFRPRCLFDLVVLVTLGRLV